MVFSHDEGADVQSDKSEGDMRAAAVMRLPFWPGSLAVRAGEFCMKAALFCPIRYNGPAPAGWPVPGGVYSPEIGQKSMRG